MLFLVFLTMPAQAQENPSSTAKHLEDEKHPKDPKQVLQDADEAVEMATEGSMEACTALVFPLTMVPYAGDTIDSVADWVCIAPAVIGGQYAEENFGQRDSFYWQATLALVAANLFGDLLLYPALATAAVLFTGYTAAALATLSVAPYFTPVAVAGMLSMSGLAYLVYKKTKKVGERWVYRVIYRLLSPQESDPLMREQIRNRAIIGPPLEATGRSWALMAAAGGAQAKWSWTWWIPFAGPINKARDRNVAIKATMRRASRHVLSDGEKIDFSAVDLTTDILTEAEGWSGAASQALLVGGVAGAAVGLSAAGLEYQNNQDLGMYAQIATISGVVGASLAGAGLLAIVIKKAAKGLIPIAIPMNYPKQDPLAKAKGHQ